MNISIHSIFFVIVVLGLSGCSDPQFGRSHNQDRIERNLPIIAENWITGNVWATETMWKQPEWNSNSGKAAHTGKKVAYQDGKRTWEEDYYYSGRKFDGSIIDPDSGTAWEKITVHYDYTAPKEPWRCHVLSDRHGGLTKITLQEAERILETWGLSRLNYKSEQDSGGNG
jgi:hypothetical protein